MTSLGSEALPARLFKAIPKLRDALVAAAQEGRVVVPAEAADATDGAVPARGLAKALAVISADCARRAEPDLAVLVVRDAALADGSDTGGGARRRAWMHFGGQDAVDAGAVAEAHVVERMTRAPGAPRSAAAQTQAPTRAPRRTPTATTTAGRVLRPPRPGSATTRRPAAAAPAPPVPPSVCADCFTVRSASGTCLCS